MNDHGPVIAACGLMLCFLAGYFGSAIKQLLKEIRDELRK